ncbi:hypothetical protein TNIN_489461 [Trichonephila inaurata madagascariensis]|uniref:Uncharacterized protein n=1 Tax=Trichonephila inaurata madagascariensis TaxID=2747483 RepID=A0A8X7BYF7_9ARAC|nr:hypothetical protein TNIN_489461 [Trichonephila inaurata madagascariensis]
MNTIQKVSTVPQLDFLERLETRKVRKVVKRSNLFEELDDYEFQRRFRLTKESVEELTLRVSQNGIINCMCRQKTLSNRSMPSSKEVLCAYQLA